MDEATLDAICIGYFYAHAVPSVQARLTLTGTEPLKSGASTALALVLPRFALVICEAPSLGPGVVMIS